MKKKKKLYAASFTRGFRESTLAGLDWTGMDWTQSVQHYIATTCTAKKNVVVLHCRCLSMQVGVRPQSGNLLLTNNFDI